MQSYILFPVKESLNMRYIKPKIPIKSSVSSKSSSEKISLLYINIFFKNFFLVLQFL
jgi:hypothetical protein